MDGLATPNVVLVAESLRRAILDGRLAPGERIKEIPLAQRLGLSRGPVREALRLLQHEGLVQIVAHRGAVVPEVRAADVLEVYALRAALGSLALHKLLFVGVPAPVPQLDARLAELEDAVARGAEQEASEADLAYQSAIVAGAGLPRAAREFERLTWQVRLFIAALDIHYEAQLPAVANEVRALHEAIAAGDGPRAERLWREKFGRWVRDFVARLPGEEAFDAELWGALAAPAAER